ncbi:LysR family transcriptional regulator [Methylocapsa sp. S129]|uniref:LysR family transcriptional regulator n=1 Tax=Methylocapsa sp. S129 TaxID=1641869 RepID=UPI00131EB059|nr:LysR family transcriptional regulator [Methylocapsa sp. S129]
MIDPLTLDQMRILVAVAETGSFSAAARRLGRVQSAVSQAVNTLEHVLGIPLFDRAGKTPILTGAGAIIVKDALRLIEGARTMKARAASIMGDVEPELTLAVDAIFPNDLLMGSLKALSGEFPQMPVSVFTEGLGGAEQRLRDGLVRFAIYPIDATGARDLAADFLTEIALIPVVAADHPLARETAPIARETLEPHVQLVLTDRTPLTHNIGGGIVSHHIWRFADLATRLEFLLAGFGWCNMPAHMVADHIAAGRLKRLETAERDAIEFRVHVVHERGREIGRAGRWLIADLRERMNGPACESQRQRLESQGLVDPHHPARDRVHRSARHAVASNLVAHDDLVPALADNPTS